ncbi:MAG: hypothetical protein J6A74_02435 [Oscillospiraceae bacterium]|nr:hypothetical protein [Oscillospiraceae bacterium]
MVRRCLILLFAVIFTVGCSPVTNSMQEGLGLRQRLLDSSGCEFDAVITANYTDCSYTFTLHCKANKAGDVSFSVEDPESISGITGTVSTTGGDLRFDDVILGFDTLADGLLSPVSTPWVFMKALRSGYLHSSQKSGDTTELIFDDTYRSETVRVCLQLGRDVLPEFCEVYWNGKRYLSMDVRNFVFL